MVIENDPSARIKVISRGQLMHPGTCGVCGNGSCDAGYVDLGVFFQYEGSFYLCVTCGKEVGEVIGLYTPEEVSHTQKLAEQLATENEELKKELENARPIVAAVSNLFTGNPLTSDLSSAASESLVALNPEPAEDTDESVTGSAGGESGPQEPTINVGGPREASAPKLRNVTFD